MKNTSVPTGPSITTSFAVTSRRSPDDPASSLERGWADGGAFEGAIGPMLLTLDEVAAELRCARRSVERHIAAHEIRAVRFGRCVRVERAELARFIADHAERPPEADDATSA